MKCYACIIKGRNIPHTDRGWGNGYVIVPKEHPAYGCHYDDEILLNIDVHGGITWSSDCLPNSDLAVFITEKPAPNKYWVLGFDTAHGGDGPHLSFDWVWGETLRFKKQMEQMAPEL